MDMTVPNAAFHPSCVNCFREILISAYCLLITLSDVKRIAHFFMDFKRMDGTIFKRRDHGRQPRNRAIILKTHPCRSSDLPADRRRNGPCSTAFEFFSPLLWRLCRSFLQWRLSAVRDHCYSSRQTALRFRGTMTR